VQTPDVWYVVIEPGVSIPTADIFSSEELTRNTKLVKIANFSGHPTCFGKNDLQIVATKLFPAVENAILWLNQYGNARMTGSGACVFCAFTDENLADAALEKVQLHLQTTHLPWKAWKSSAMGLHPLKDL
ncbi:MAG: 4-(cytidine 5'-diphospho)-2-C-methyl-D-erythritol kinase, partial [Glaciimonas sp.]|nr:4-(cytidine 5'-diphospho)-2-C-methyl-D-erythritol kinase [Glaciimonas sp.]